MAREWNDDEIKAEIAAAVKIVAEDKERAEYGRLHEKYKPNPDTDPPEDGKAPPPAKDNATGGDPPAVKKRRSLWWGEALEEPEGSGGDGGGS